MAAATTYYNCPVLIGEGGEAGDQPSFFVAQQASIEESLPLLPVKSLGQTSVLNTIPENTLQGTISISYLLSAGTAGAGRALPATTNERSRRHRTPAQDGDRAHRGTRSRPGRSLRDRAGERQRAHRRRNRRARR